MFSHSHKAGTSLQHGCVGGRSSEETRGFVGALVVANIRSDVESLQFLARVSWLRRWSSTMTKWKHLNKNKKKQRKMGKTNMRKMKNEGKNQKQEIEEKKKKEKRKYLFNMMKNKHVPSLPLLKKKKRPRQGLFCGSRFHRLFLGSLVAAGSVPSLHVMVLQKCAWASKHDARSLAESAREHQTAWPMRKAWHPGAKPATGELMQDELCLQRGKRRALGRVRESERRECRTQARYPRVARSLPPRKAARGWVEAANNTESVANSYTQSWPAQHRRTHRDTRFEISMH